MRLRGYMQEVELTNEALTIEGTNKAARVALRAEEHDRGPLVVPRSEITSVEHKPGNALVNGHITIHTTDGKKAILHFRRKSNAEFAALAEALGA